MTPQFELRWAVKEGTNIDRPELEFRQKGEMGEWGPWTKVPFVVVSRREQIYRELF